MEAGLGKSRSSVWGRTTRRVSLGLRYCSEDTRGRHTKKTTYTNGGETHIRGRKQPCTQTDRHAQNRPTSGPCLSGPCLSGPDVCLDPVSPDPVCLDPVYLDPVCLDPVCLDPICLDPVCLNLPGAGSAGSRRCCSRESAERQKNPDSLLA